MADQGVSVTRRRFEYATLRFAASQAVRCEAGKLAGSDN
jgi:hypothetical protein